MIYGSKDELPIEAEGLKRRASARLSSFPVTPKQAERAFAERELAKDLLAQYVRLCGRSGFGGFQPPAVISH
jgi:hypothetical protein